MPGVDLCCVLVDGFWSGIGCRERREREGNKERERREREGNKERERRGRGNQGKGREREKGRERREMERKKTRERRRDRRSRENKKREGGRTKAIEQGRRRERTFFVPPVSLCPCVQSVVGQLPYTAPGR